MTLTFYPLRAKVQGQRSVGSGNKRTDRRTEGIALPPTLMRSVINYLSRGYYNDYGTSEVRRCSVSSEGEQRVGDDVDGVSQLLFGDDERRSEADLVVVCRLRDQTVVTQPQTHLPRVELCQQTTQNKNHWHSRAEQGLTSHQTHTHTRTTV